MKTSMKKRMTNWLKAYLEDLLALLGCVCVLIGLAQISIVLTWIFGGLMLCAWSVVIGRAKARAAENADWYTELKEQSHDH